MKCTSHLNRCRLAVTIACGFIAASALPTATAQADQEKNAVKPPNIVFMMVDNLGYGDIGSYGGGAVRGVPTPRLDEFASQGVRLTNFMVEPECTPSRSALMTGRMPIRSGTDSVQVAGSLDGLVPCEYTLAELLSDAGYSTVLFGKWHLGTPQTRLPTVQGFDRWYGIPRSSAESLWGAQPGFSSSGVSPEFVQQGVKGSNSTNVVVYDVQARAMMDTNLTDMAVEYIKEHANGEKPFFLYMPFTLPHTPPLPSPAFDNPTRSKYQNVLAEIDHNAGRIFDAIKAANIDSNTVVVWTSDNGPETMQGPGVDYGGGSDTGPFRGEFPSAWEGAIRTPCIIRWFGHTKPGRASNEIMSIQDFYRTFARLADASHLVPTDRAVDSIDQHDFLFGDQDTSNRESLAWFLDSALMAVKWRNFKVHLRVRENARGAVVQPGQGVITSFAQQLGKPWIFDLENDPKELWNLAVPNAWVGTKANQLLASYLSSVKQYPNIPQGASTCPWSNAPVENEDSGLVKGLLLSKRRALSSLDDADALGEL